MHGQHSRRRGKSKGEGGAEEGPWQPSWAMPGTCLCSESPIPNPQLSLSKAAYFTKVWRLQFTVSLSFPLHGTLTTACFLFAKVIRMEMTRTL